MKAFELLLVDYEYLLSVHYIQLCVGVILLIVAGCKCIVCVMSILLCEVVYVSYSSVSEFDSSPETLWFSIRLGLFLIFKLNVPDNILVV